MSILHDLWDDADDRQCRLVLRILDGSASPEALDIIEAVLDETFIPKLVWYTAEMNAWLQAEFYWSLRDEKVRFSIPVVDFPLIRAIIAGEAKCETCYFEELDGNHSPCADCMWSKLDEWSPKEDER